MLVLGILVKFSFPKNNMRLKKKITNFKLVGGLFIYLKVLNETIGP